MLELTSFSFNPFQENTYVIYNEKKDCWIVDPGMYDLSETKIIDDFIQSQQLKPRAIINTHAHIDHILGVNYLKEKYEIPFYLHEKDLPVLKNAIGSAMMFGLPFKDIPEVNYFIHENEKLILGEDELDVFFTPGHSPGSVVFYYPGGGWAVAGDVLFNGSIGRTDLPGGDHETLISSIKEKLFPLPDATIIYPGHGPETSIGREKVSNPFL